MNSLYQKIYKYKVLMAWLFGFFFYLMPFLQNDLNYVFISDSLLKLLQADSVIKNGFRSDELIYSFKEIDPDYKFFPISDFTFESNRKRFSQYPTLFAYISAVFLKFLNESALMYFVIFVGFIVVFFMQSYFKLSFYSFLLLVFGTPIVFYGYEFSENTLFLLVSFVAYALTLHERFFSNKAYQVIVSILLGISMHLRLEAFVFCSIYFPIFFIVLYFRKKESVFSILKTFFPLIVSFLFIATSLFIFNFYQYGHPFGSRFIISGGNKFDIVIKLKQMFVLFFFGLRKVGFFGYTPLFLFLLFLYFRKALKGDLPWKIQVLYFVLLFYVPILSFLTGSESFVNWGPRYLALSLFPAILLTDYHTKNFSTIPRLKKLTLVLLLIYSFYITWKGIQIQTHSFKLIKSAHSLLFSHEADIFLIDDQFLAGFSGKEFRTKKILVIQDFEFFKATHNKIIDFQKFNRVIYISSNIKKGFFEEDELSDNLIARFLRWVTTRKFEGFKVEQKDIEARREFMQKHYLLKKIDQNEYFNKYFVEAKP